MALRPTGLCEGGEPITDAPCAKCGATENDECGAINDQEYVMGLRSLKLAEALRRMVYETTHLSPCEDDGSHWCRISKEALEAARAALS